MTEEALSLEERAENDQNDDSQNSFDSQLSPQMNLFQEACNDPNIQLAIGIIVHKDSKEPTIYHKGHMYNVAALLAHVLRNMKKELYENLDT